MPPVRNKSEHDRVRIATLIEKGYSSREVAWKLAVFVALRQQVHMLEDQGKADQGEVQEDSQTSQNLQEVSKMPENVSPENSEQIVTSEERVTQGRYAPKRYVTTCYFQPKQLPVWYSETMIVNIGSTKKKYFESIYYENKLSPSHWTESMTTIIPDSEEPILVNSTVDIPISPPEFHYISLESQQIAAIAK